jgi:hypothetical protein
MDSFTDYFRQTRVGCPQHARRPRTYKRLVSYARKNCVHESWSDQSDRHGIAYLPKRTCNQRLLLGRALRYLKGRCRMSPHERRHAGWLKLHCYDPERKRHGREQ